LAEIKTLRAVERIPQLRPQNSAYDGQFQIPTLQEVIDLAQAESKARKRTIGIYPETKHPTYFDSIGLSLEEPLVATLYQNGYHGPNAPLFIQSFEVANLKDLARMTKVPLVQLLNASGKPYDFVVSGDARTYADLATPTGLAEIATYAVGIGANKNLIIPRDSSGKLLAPTTLIDDAHAAGLLVHGWTFRNENTFLPTDFRRGDPADPTYLRQYGDAAGEYQRFLGLGLDGVFSDNPDTAVAARDDLARGSTEATLEGRAVLPAQTFAPGPPSGTLLGAGPINGITLPFASQPVQGISGVLDAGNGSFYILEDNGYGAKNNSADFLLRLYRVRPDFETAGGGSGTVEVGDFIQLRDPDRKVPFAIVQEQSSERLLTGADFDIESVRQDKQGDFWFGDEFGPFLLHTDATGRLLEAPIPLPGVQSPDNPTRGTAAPTLPSSRGFEGMAITPDGKTLYPMLEGALISDPDQRRRLIYEFDLRRGAYTGRTYHYRVEASGNAIGDLTARDPHRLLVIERDGGQGASAAFKRIFLVDLRHTDAAGRLVKRDLVDLLRVRDPYGISLPAQAGDLGLGDPFSFPFVTIESVLPLDRTRLLVINDNNFPFSTGRNPARPDDTEFIILRIQPADW
ncbi:MAG TPA: esterase-like activity of phytase family protein, partial [Roseiflexaceae bacterium]|nr:esterase-like activity of phytase family protein [Roseiflexaceae bacterium]